MKNLKWLLIVAFIFVSSQALNDLSVPNTFVEGATIYASDFNENDDTTEVVINSNNDTIEIKFIRFTDLTGHDSTLSFVKIDSIRNSPNIDTIIGNKFTDTVNTKKITSADSVKCVNLKTTDSVLIGSGLYVVKSIRTADSLVTTKGIRSAESIRGDSLISDKGIRAVADINGVDIIASSDLTATDSVGAGKGIRAVGSIRGDSILSDKGIRAVGSIRGDSANIIKGLNVGGYTTLGGNNGIKFWSYKRIVTSADTVAGLTVPQIPITPVAIGNVFGLDVVIKKSGASGGYLYKIYQINENYGIHTMSLTGNDSITVVLSHPVSQAVPPDTLNISFFTVP
jgi:hypothetical protein